MAYMPILSQSAQKSRVATQVFGGLNRRMYTRDGEWREEKNMGGQDYPLMATRRARGLVRTLTSAQGMLAKDELYYVDGASMYCDGTEITGLTLSTSAQDIPKTLVSMGAYILIFPDKKYYNTKDATDKGDIEAHFTSLDDAVISYSPCRADGTEYENITAASAAPSTPKNGAYWLDTSQDKHELKVYSSAAGAWVSIATVYARIGCPSIGASFAAGDVVEIGGCACDAGAAETLSAQTTALNGTREIMARGDNWIVITGLLDASHMQTTGTVTVKREVPDMEFVIESENRLWGCHYGLGADGKALNEIYACALGDFRNWRKYGTGAMCSYTSSVGTDGAFTGAVTYMGYPMFFKETCVHKVYGSQPKNYEIQTTPLRGVRAGSGKSLANVDGTLYYHSRAGIEAYDGSMPTLVSEALGEDTLTDAVAGAIGVHYYVSAKDSADAYSLYTYDAQRDVWHREDATQALDFAQYGSDLYFIDAAGRMWCAYATAGTKEVAIAWSAESGVQAYDLTEHKHIARFNVRAKLDRNAYARLYIQYDSNGVWQLKGTMTASAQKTGTFLLPVLPRRCDHLQLKIEGVGNVWVYAVARVMTKGGDGQCG